MHPGLSQSHKKLHRLSMDGKKGYIEHTHPRHTCSLPRPSLALSPSDSESYMRALTPTLFPQALDNLAPSLDNQTCP